MIKIEELRIANSMLIPGKGIQANLGKVLSKVR